LKEQDCHATRPGDDFFIRYSEGMNSRYRYWLFLALVAIVTGISVFVLPFWFPHPFIPLLSVSNAAGFNNQFAAAAAALCAFFVLLISLFVDVPLFIDVCQPSPGESTVDLRPLPRSFWLSVVCIVGTCEAIAAWIVHISHVSYPSDLDYFVTQMQSAAAYGRHLYTQIEFPYGPLLFYPQIWLYKVLAGTHISLQACYLTVWVAHQIAGILLLAYLVNVLPMSSRWKKIALCCFACFAFLPMFGLNYTLFRFVIPMAALVFAIKAGRVWTWTALLFALGQILNLAVSPEMGFAFAAGAIAYAVLQGLLVRRVWLLAALSVPVGTVCFLLVVGKPYLRMLRLFAGGAFNFIVEPQPFTLLFLAAFVWVVPRMLAARWRQKQPDTLLLGACAVLSTALIPVAFGRADPVHVFLNGLGILLLSFVGISRFGRRPQMAWAVCLPIIMLMGYVCVILLYQGNIRTAVGAVRRFKGRAAETSAAAKLPFDSDELQAVTGNEKIAMPFDISIAAEEALVRTGQYCPSFYFFMTAVFDPAGEQLKIQEMNRLQWALVPTGGMTFRASQTQQLADAVLGIRLPYRMKHEPYVAGDLISRNLRTNWKPAGTFGDYTLLRNRQVTSGSCEAPQ
jgi:uncharacterized membrane protein